LRKPQWRGIATRYDKKAINYRAGIVLAGVILWLRT
jgi:transposase